MTQPVEQMVMDRGRQKEKFWTQHLAVTAATMVSTAAGINLAWFGRSIPRLMSGESPYTITYDHIRYLSYAVPIGMVVGSLISAILVDILGRKITLLSAALPQFFSFLCIYLSTMSLSLIYLSNLLGGIGHGINLTITTIYISEIAHPSIRGRLGSLMMLMFLNGILVIYSIDSFFTIQTGSLIYAVYPVIFVGSFIWMPETPYYLLMKNSPNKARKSLRFLRQIQDVEEELMKLTADVRRQTSERRSLLDLIQSQANRKALLIGMGLKTVQRFSGYMILNFYLHSDFSEVFDLSDISMKIYIFLPPSIQLVMAFISSMVVDRAGRKPLLILSCLVCMVALLTKLICSWFTAFSNIEMRWMPLASSICFIMFYTLGLLTVVEVMLGELFSINIKAKSLAVINIYGNLIGFIMASLVSHVISWIGPRILFFVFSLFCALGAIFSWKFVPETKRKTLEEIQQGFK